MITETAVAASANSRESGRRMSNSSMTGRPVQSEVPKSKRSTPQSHVPNCTQSGWSRPSRWRMAASCLGSMWPPASPPKIRRATSPGMTRMMKNTSAAAPSSVGMIRSSRFAMYVCTPACASVLGQPDVLELLVRVVVGRRHVVLHLGPVHDVARPPEARHVVDVLQHDLLELLHEPAPLAVVERARLAREQIVDRGAAEAAPVLRVAGRVAAEEHVGIVAVFHGRRDDQLEAAGVSTIGEPGGGLERPVIGLDADLAPLLDREDGQVLVR